MEVEIDDASTELDEVPPVTKLPPRPRKLLTQASTIAMRRQNAICVRRAHKMYGTKKNPNIILDGLNMTVPKGTIYGLLGASGCGKTTLLSCIVGTRRLNAGEIWVLGGQPGSRGSGVPGPRIGYMPQDIALYGEFTIRETFIYFGWMSGMKTPDIEEKIEFYLKLLELPNASRFVKNLSGGQQRRTSLAAALLHDPELLILDEPTVGVDPVVRQNIWDHLVDLTKYGHKTIIITTHYIEETRQATLIGLMRGGKLLAEESPDNLLQKYNCISLEDVFLKLAVIQNLGKRRRSSIAQVVTEKVEISDVVSSEAIDMSEEDIGELSGEFGDNISMSARQRDLSTIAIISPPPPVPLPPKDPIPTRNFADNFKVFNSNHMKAMIWKNFIWMLRNFGIMVFVAVLPGALITIFCLAIGHDPIGLKLAVANQELTQEMIQNQDCPFTLGCNSTYLSCRYLSYLQNNKSMVLSHFESTDIANEEVRNGRAWGSISFASNYTDALKARTEFGDKIDDMDLLLGIINIHLDMTDQQVSHLIYRDIQYSFFDFITDVLKECDISARYAVPPVLLNTPIYGETKPIFTDFAAPGIILTAVFFLSFALTAGAMLSERSEGMLERCLVLGASVVEILFSHVISQFLIMVGQSAIVLIFMFSIFGAVNHGNMYSIILLTILTGLCGMSFGFVLSCAMGSERNAMYMGMGSLLPMVMLSGIIWPIEGMYPPLRAIAFFSPLTKCSQALRYMLQRGWDFEESEVWIGYVSVSSWVIIFMAVSILVLKFNKG